MKRIYFMGIIVVDGCNPNEPSDEYPYYKLTVDPVGGARMEEYR